MTDLDEIIREAYASAPQNVIVLHTLEILHPAFDKPARVCRWPITGDEPEVFHCLLEPDAQQDAGKIVDLLGVRFDILQPEKSAEQLTARLRFVSTISGMLWMRSWKRQCCMAHRSRARTANT